MVKLPILRLNLENPMKEPDVPEKKSPEGREGELDGSLQLFLHWVILFLVYFPTSCQQYEINYAFIGLASPGLIVNEIDLKNAERDRDAHQSNANERRQTLNMVQNNLRDISHRLSVTEQSIVGTEDNLNSVRFVLGKLKSKDPAMRGFGDKIRNITTYLTVCQGQVEVIYSQQKLLLLFEPLLLSIDELVLFLESNDETTSLLAEKQIVEKIHNYMKKN